MNYFDTHLDGVLRLDRQQFDETEKEAAVLYVVDEEDGFSLYLGNKSLLIWRELQNTASSLNRVVHRLGFAAYPFPDIMGTGSVSSEAASYMLEFSANVAAGEYAEYPTQPEKWAAFAAENGLRDDVFPDVNGDGVVNSEDAAIVTDFAAQVGAGTYPNTPEGFRAYMLDYDNAVFGAGISGFRMISRAEYDLLSEKRDDIIYFVKDNGSISVHVGKLRSSGGGTPLGILKQNKPLSEAMSAETPSGVMEWTEEVRYP